jgi:exopolysaccharide biosynthesis polyprenyl glycosylphosphotransferase
MKLELDTLGRGRLAGDLRWSEPRPVEPGDAGGTGEPRVAPAAVECAERSAYPLRRQRALLLAWMVACDALALAAAFGLAFWIRFDLQFTLAPEVVAPKEWYVTLSVWMGALWLGVFAYFELYDLQARSGGPVESARTFHACTMSATLVVVATYVVQSFVVSRGWLLVSWVLTFVLVAAGRLVTRRGVQALRRRGYLLAPAVIVGTNDEARTLAAFLADHEASGVLALGFLSTDRGCSSPGLPLPVLGGLDSIGSLVVRHELEDVIVAITSLSREELLSLCEDVDELPVQLRLSSGLYEMLTTRVRVRTLGTVPLMSLQKNRLDRREAFVKGVLDKGLALLGLLVLSPVLLALGVAIKLDSPGPLLHRRRVMGAGGRQFDAFKFRTMFVNGAEILRAHPDAARELAENHKLKDDPRITKVGRWLRKLSLDELPQLVNVLTGQMSLVGPRMITFAEAEKYGRHRLNLFTVKPGITGLWQVSGRSDLTYDERVRIDMFYVRHYSIWLDLQILFIQTLPAVLRSRGAY